MARGDFFLGGLDFGVLEAEELGDAAGEVGFDFLEGAVGIDDAPDGLDQAESLVAGEVVAQELREMEEVYALPPLFLGQAEDLGELVPGNVHLLPDVARDAVPLLWTEDVVGVRDLQEQRAGRDRDRVGPGALLRPGRTGGEEGADGVYAHETSVMRKVLGVRC